MAFDKELRHNVINFVENFPINIGKVLYFEESICTNKNNFDRHFTTFSSTEFTLTNFAGRISGARLMFIGDKLSYEIGLDYIIHFNEKENECEFIEAYSEEIYRRTILKISNDSI